MIIYAPSLYHTLTALTGHIKGIPAFIVANDDPIILITPRSCVFVIAKGVIVRTTSFIIHFGNIGLRARSVNLELRIA